jgi:AcrR family transcriptional regulator
VRADARHNRQRVLVAARDVFAEHGTDAPVSLIARRAGVGKGTIYRHFPAKEQLFAAVIADRLSELAEAARRSLTTGDPTTALFSLIEQLVDEASSSRAMADALRQPAGDGEIARHQQELRDAISRLLARARATGRTRGDVDASALVSLLVGTTSG